MSRLFILLLVVGTLGCISICQASRISPSEASSVSRHDLPSKPTRIINGEAADIRDFPYMASLQYNGTFYGHDYDHFCCGTILSDRWVITAAQCGQARGIDEFHVRVGSAKYYEGGVIHTIDKVVTHPNFNELSRDYDFALLKLTKKIELDENVKPIGLPKGNEVLQDKTNFSIAGWGASELLGKMSDELLKSHIEKMNERDCRSAYGESVTDRMLCAFTPGFGPCVGDTGSAAVYDNKLLGFASWSYGCAYKLPTVYTRVSSVLRWIEETTA